MDLGHCCSSHFSGWKTSRFMCHWLHNYVMKTSNFHVNLTSLQEVLQIGVSEIFFRLLAFPGELYYLQPATTAVVFLNRMSRRITCLCVRGMKWQEAGENCAMRSSIMCTVHEVLLGRSIKGKRSIGKPKLRRQYNINMDLKGRPQCVRLWSGFIWLGILTGGGLLWRR
jgi:hypothetical protein